MTKMKNVNMIPAFLMLALTACGPAAEDRETMHKKARIFQDSIAHNIHTQMAEAEGPAPVQAQTVAPSAGPLSPAPAPGTAPNK